MTTPRIAVALFILIPNLVMGDWMTELPLTKQNAQPATERMQRANPQQEVFRAWFLATQRKLLYADLAKDITEKAKHSATVKSLTPDPGEGDCDLRSELAEVAAVIGCSSSRSAACRKLGGRRMNSRPEGSMKMSAQLRRKRKYHPADSFASRQSPFLIGSARWNSPPGLRMLANPSPVFFSLRPRRVSARFP